MVLPQELERLLFQCNYVLYGCKVLSVYLVVSMLDYGNAHTGEYVPFSKNGPCFGSAVTA